VPYVGEKSLGRSIFPTDVGCTDHVRGSRCPQCGDVRFPARVLCPNDLSECEDYLISGKGVIYEAVYVSVPPQGFGKPYWAAYVDLEHDVRIFAWVATENSERDPAHGDCVDLSVGMVTEFEEPPLYGPIFRRV
jgi:uncharacterized OB-fold protein